MPENPSFETSTIQEKKGRLSHVSNESPKWNEDREKADEKLQSYGWFFKIEIPNERQSAIEYDLEAICTLQGCTIEDVLKINHITIGQLKPGKIITIPVILWDENEEELEHKTEPKRQEIDWNKQNPSEETKKMAQWIIENHATDTSLIFDKKEARMYILKDGKVRYSTIFLSGKNSTKDTMSFPALTEDFSEETNPEFMITPAWKFPITMDVSAPGYPISFDYIYWVDATGSIHAPTEKSRQINLQRLKTPSIEDNNTSWGCMVMTPEALETIKKSYQPNKTFSYVIPLHWDIEEYIPLSKTKNSNR